MSGEAKQILAGFELSDEDWRFADQACVVFDKHDKDGSGKLDTSELQPLCDTANKNLKAKGLKITITPQKVIDCGDLDNDKEVSKKEFLITLLVASKENVITCLFNSFDTDRDGKISAEELLKGISCTRDFTEKDKECSEKIISKIGDGDGYLDQNEFKNEFLKSMFSKK